MAGVVQKVAVRFVEGWFTGTPGASVIASAVAEVLADALNQLVSAYSSVAGGGTATGDDLLRLAFAVPQGATDDEAAEHVTRLLLAWLPDDCKSFMGSVPSRLVGFDPSLAPSSADSGDTADLDELLYGEKQPSKRDDQREKAKQVLMAMGSVVPEQWTLTNVVRALEELRRRFEKDIGKNTAAALAEIKKEAATTLPMRGAVAGSFAAGGALATVVSKQVVRTMLPNAVAGREVHMVLQDRYRSRHSQHLIVQDSRVFRPFPPGAKRTGGQPYERLSRAAIAGGRSGDASLTALFLARQPAILREVLLVGRGSLRDDTIDMTFGQNWEIKPIGSALQAVGQEFFYRSSYNVFSGLIQDWGFPVHTKVVRAGVPWDDPELSRIFPIDGRLVGTQDPVFVVPLAIQELPGLVLYLLASIPLRALKKLMQDLIKQLEDVAKQIERLFDGLATAVAVVCKALIAVALIIGVAIFTFVMLRPELAVAAVGAVVVGGVLIYQWAEDRKSGEGEQAQAQPSSDLPERVSVAIGPIRLVNMPTRLLTGKTGVPAVGDTVAQVVKSLT